MTEAKSIQACAWDIQFTRPISGSKYRQNNRAMVLSLDALDAITACLARFPDMELVGIQKRAGKTELLIDKAMFSAVMDIEEMRAEGLVTGDNTAYDMTNKQLADVLISEIDPLTSSDDLAAALNEVTRRLKMSDEIKEKTP